MEPTKKAKELVDKMKEQFFMEHDNVKVLKAKQCALICVDEILKTNPNNLVEVTEKERGIISEFKWNVKYWQQVKQEINNL